MQRLVHERVFEIHISWSFFCFRWKVISCLNDSVSVIFNLDGAENMLLWVITMAQKESSVWNSLPVKGSLCHWSIPIVQWFIFMLGGIHKGRPAKIKILKTPPLSILGCPKAWNPPTPTGLQIDHRIKMIKKPCICP